jgi:phosphotriesterase-related protein
MIGPLMAKLITTLGEKSLEDLGLILPHEHIFVDLGDVAAESYKNADAAEVLHIMSPEIEQAKNAGVTALVECTPVGVGRRVDIVKAVSEATNFPVVVATGIYREPWVPVWAQEAAQGKLESWLIAELLTGIEDTGVKAGFIKLSAGDDGITDIETKILRAAASAGRMTNATIGSHTVRGRVVLRQIKILEEEGYTPERFIWIHTQAESDTGLHLEVAERGSWLEFDAIGSEAFSDEYFIERILTLIDAGFAEQLLLSQDRGWYDPSKPKGGSQQPYTYLTEIFLPKLRAAGVDDAMIEQLTRFNPFGAFAR